MAVNVAVKGSGPRPAGSVKHETGKSYAVRDGDLFVYDNAEWQNPTNQVAVYARDTWLSAVVEKG